MLMTFLPETSSTMPHVDYPYMKKRAYNSCSLPAFGVNENRPLHAICMNVLEVTRPGPRADRWGGLTLTLTLPLTPTFVNGPLDMVVFGHRTGSEEDSPSILSFRCGLPPVQIFLHVDILQQVFISC